MYEKNGQAGKQAIKEFKSALSLSFLKVGLHVASLTHLSLCSHK